MDHPIASPRRGQREQEAGVLILPGGDRGRSPPATASRRRPSVRTCRNSRSRSSRRRGSRARDSRPARAPAAAPGSRGASPCAAAREFHRASCAKCSRSKSAPSSRFSRTSRLQLNAAVTPSGSSYAACSCSTGLTRSAPMSSVSPRSMAPRMSCSSAAASGGSKLPMLEPRNATSSVSPSRARLRHLPQADLVARHVRVDRDARQPPQPRRRRVEGGSRDVDQVHVEGVIVAACRPASAWPVSRRCRARVRRRAADVPQPRGWPPVRLQQGRFGAGNRVPGQVADRVEQRRPERVVERMRGEPSRPIARAARRPLRQTSAAPSLRLPVHARHAVSQRRARRHQAHRWRGAHACTSTVRNVA